MSNSIHEGYVRLEHIEPAYNEDRWVILLRDVSGAVQPYLHKAPWSDSEMRRMREIWIKGGESDKELVLTWVSSLLGFDLEPELPRGAEASVIIPCPPGEICI